MDDQLFFFVTRILSLIIITIVVGFTLVILLVPWFDHFLTRYDRWVKSIFDRKK